MSPPENLRVRDINAFILLICVGDKDFSHVSGVFSF